MSPILLGAERSDRSFGRFDRPKIGPKDRLAVQEPIGLDDSQLKQSDCKGMIDAETLAKSAQ